MIVPFRPADFASSISLPQDHMLHSLVVVVGKQAYGKKIDPRSVQRVQQQHHVA